MPNPLPEASALKACMEAQQWLFLDGEENAVSALKKAALWLAGEYRRFDPAEQPDYTDELLRQVLLERAIYELYKMAGAASAGAAHKADAQALVWDYFGYDPDAETAQRGGPPAAAVVARRRPAFLEGFAGAG